MAGKQLGKFRQWAGEVISSREKTQPSSEFVQMERDVEIRRKGLERLQVASEDYHAHLSRKQVSEIVEGDDKLMHTEALGVVMIAHGEELDAENAFGQTLITFGRARCQIAAIQEAYAVTLSDTFLSYLRQCISQLEEYSAQRKKLESRRLTLDAAINKSEKTHKKEKDQKDAEEELQKARARYEETAEDLDARMRTIQENQVSHAMELAGFLDLEMKFVEQYLEILKGAKADLPQDLSTRKKDTSPPATANEFSRSTTRSSESKETEAKSSLAAKFSSIRSFRSLRSNSARQDALEQADREDEPCDPDEEKPQSHPGSLRKKSSAGSSAAPSRPSSRQARDRSESTATINGRSDNDKSKRKSTMTGWVGDAMTNVIGRGRNKGPDEKNFAELDTDTDEEDREGAKWKRPRSALSNRSSRSAKSILGRTSSQQPREREERDGKRKKMKALFDFSGSMDELSFKAGDEILVLNEVLDDWWLGELDGRKGLFPTTYTAPIKNSGSPTKSTSSLPSKRRNSSSHSILGLGNLSLAISSNVSSEDEESRKTLVNDTDGDVSLDDNSSVSDFPSEDHHVLGHRVTNTMMIPARHANDVSDAEDGEPTVPNSRFTYHQHPQSTPTVYGTTSDTVPSVTRVESGGNSPVKRAPPPPPPRRKSLTGITPLPPPLPARNGNLTPSRSQVSSTMPRASPPPLQQPELSHSHSENSSPFESCSDLSFDAVAKTSALPDAAARCGSCGCLEAAPPTNPFGAYRECIKCSHVH